MTDRTYDDSELPQRNAGGRRRAQGTTLTGRAFASGEKRADDRREQAADGRGQRAEEPGEDQG